VRWRGLAAVVNDVRTKKASIQLKKKIAGRESQGVVAKMN
jgi:hypothetical protein